MNGRMNKFVQNIKSYAFEVKHSNVKRLHNNESQSPILPMEILLQNCNFPLNFYPEIVVENLINLAGKFYEANSQLIIPTNGSDEGLDLIIRTFGNVGENIVVLNPTFSMYKNYATACGMNVLEFNLTQNFTLDVENLIDFCQKCEAKMLFLPNPLAPTGGITSSDDVLKIIQNLPKTIVIVDEAYVEFSGQKSMITHIQTFQNLFVTRTLSKFFGLAGIRLGFVFTSFKSEILKVKAPYNVNSITAQIGINLLENIKSEDIAKRCLLNEKSKVEMIEFLKNFPEVVKIHESYANFLFIELNSKSQTFEAKLLKLHNMRIKSFSGKFENYCRISL